MTHLLDFKILAVIAGQMSQEGPIHCPWYSLGSGNLAP